MLIKDVTEQTGLSPDTIRYYEKEGLINKPSAASNGYQLSIGNDIVTQLNMIQRAKIWAFR